MLSDREGQAQVRDLAHTTPCQCEQSNSQGFQLQGLVQIFPVPSHAPGTRHTDSGDKAWPTSASPLSLPGTDEDTLLSSFTGKETMGLSNLLRYKRAAKNGEQSRRAGQVLCSTDVLPYGGWDPGPCTLSCLRCGHPLLVTAILAAGQGSNFTTYEPPHLSRRGMSDPQSKRGETSVSVVTGYPAST